MQCNSVFSCKNWHNNKENKSYAIQGAYVFQEPIVNYSTTVVNKRASKQLLTSASFVQTNYTDWSVNPFNASISLNQSQGHTSRLLANVSCCWHSLVSRAASLTNARGTLLLWFDCKGTIVLRNSSSRCNGKASKAALGKPAAMGKPATLQLCPSVFLQDVIQLNTFSSKILQGHVVGCVCLINVQHEWEVKK